MKLTTHFNIDVCNPLCVLDQLTAENFITKYNSAELSTFYKTASLLAVKNDLEKKDALISTKRNLAV